MEICNWLCTRLTQLSNACVNQLIEIPLLLSHWLRWIQYTIIKLFISFYFDCTLTLVYALAVCSGAPTTSPVSVTLRAISSPVCTVLYHMYSCCNRHWKIFILLVFQLQIWKIWYYTSPLNIITPVFWSSIITLYLSITFSHFTKILLSAISLFPVLRVLFLIR